MLALFLTAIAAQPVALVELFTSQGCSSCPPADAILGEIAERSRQHERPVFVLSFHVDYWDKLGWADPYSDARWTTRQRDYSRTLGQKGRVYTPQVVVNGVDHGVGNQRGLVHAMVKRALEHDAPVALDGVASFEEKRVRVDIKVDGAPSDARMFVALVEKRRENAIARGENAGGVAVHHNVVRNMVVSDAASTKGVLELPMGVVEGNAEVFVWVQDGLSNAVLGAARLD